MKNLKLLMMSLVLCSCSSGFFQKQKSRSVSSFDELVVGAHFFVDKEQKQFAKITEINAKGEVSFEVINGLRYSPEQDIFKKGELYTFPESHFRKFKSYLLFRSEGPLEPKQYFLKYQNVHLIPFPQEYDEAVDFRSAKRTSILDPIVGKNQVGSVKVSAPGEPTPFVDVDRVVVLVPKRGGIVIGDEFKSSGRAHTVQAIFDNGAMEVMDQRGQLISGKFHTSDFTRVKGSLLVKSEQPTACAEAIVSLFKLFK